MAFVERSRSQLSTMWILALLICNCKGGFIPEPGTFYIRHYFGNCLEFDVTRQVFAFRSICREKFMWLSGAKILHIPTKKCMFVNSTADGSFLVLSTNCNSTSNLFQYDEIKKVIIHLISAKCLHAESGPNDPSTGTAVVIKSGCDIDTNKFYFRANAYYKIRHFSGYCWVYDSSDSYIKLKNTVCDRFEYKNDFHLRHVNTGKCVTYVDSSPHYLTLTDDCRSPKTVYRLNEYANIQLSSDVCVHPHSGMVKPPVNDYVVRYPGCSNSDAIRFYFYDERDTLKVKMTSNTCDDVSTCSETMGHVNVNGFQYSLNTRGINTVIFDYRSGMFEHKSSYDVYGSSNARIDLAAFLNGLTPGKILFMAVKDAVTLDKNSALALQKYGVSATFASTSLPKPRCSMVTIVYTGTERKEWEKSINKVGGTGGASVIEATIYTFREQDGKDDCSNEIGIQSKKIPDSAFTAPSTWKNDANHRPHKGRLNDPPVGWCSAINAPISTYLQVDLGQVKIVTGIAIQSHGGNGNHYVTKFSLKYSVDNIHWSFYAGIGNSNNTMVFEGIRKQTINEIRVNWFEKTMLRHLQIIPSERASFGAITCLRIELYGCSPYHPLIINNEMTSTNLNVTDIYRKSMQLHYTATYATQATFGISTSENILATNIDQLQFKGINTSSYNNGTLTNLTKINIMQDPLTKADSFAEIHFNFIEANHHSFGIDSLFQVLDAKQPTGHTWLVTSFKTDDQFSVNCQKVNLSRVSNDRSVIHLNITDLDEAEIVDGETIQLNVSLSHLLGGPEGSHSNAYDVDVFIYYESSFFEVQSVNFIEKDRFTLAPTRSSNEQGFIHAYTKTLWLMNNQHMSVTLKSNNPKAIWKGEQCKGSFLIDLAFKNNLHQFNGTANNTVGKKVEYKCIIDEWKDISLKSLRLNMPKMSMAYDDLNGEFFFCILTATYAKRNGPFCYMQKTDTNAWYGIDHAVAAVVGIDAASRVLYGIHQTGQAYVRVSYPYEKIYQIEDSYWMKRESSPETRKAIMVNDLKTLPSKPKEEFVISASGKQQWAVTRSGISKKTDGLWKEIVKF